MIATFSLEKKNQNFWWIFHRFFLGYRCGNDWTFPRAQRLQTKKLYKVCQFLEVLGIYLIDWTDICLLGNVFDLGYMSKVTLLTVFSNKLSFSLWVHPLYKPSVHEIFPFSVLVKFSKSYKNSVIIDLVFILQSLNSFNTWFWCRMSHFKHALMYWYYLLNYKLISRVNQWTCFYIVGTPT